MNIIFWGTPHFASHSLEQLITRGYTVKAVVTAPDKQKGRGLKLAYSDVKETALKYNLPVLQPEKLSSPGFIEELMQFKPDIFTVIAFRILPKEIFGLPVKSCFNLHGSLLPQLRGAAPIQWALINGLKKTGVTTFEIEPKVDTGKVYLKKETDISNTDDFGSLHDRLMVLGADAICETIDMIQSGNVTLLPQDDTLATPAPKITKELCALDFSKPAVDIQNLVRGLSPFPGAFTIFRDKILKIYKTTPVQTEMVLPPGMHLYDNKLLISANPGTLEILELQPEGKKRMTAPEYLRGIR